MARGKGGRNTGIVRSVLDAFNEMGNAAKVERYRQSLLKKGIEVGEIPENDKGLFNWLRRGGDYENN